MKTDGQGEVIGLFLKEEIPRGMSFADTIAAIKAQDGLVYLPHPFDRMHAIPDPSTLHRHLADIDVFEVYNARLLFEGYNDEALRFARKYNLTMGAGSDAHVLQGSARAASACAPSTAPRSSCSACAVPKSCGARSRSLPAVPEVGRPGQGKSSLGENWNKAAVTSVSTDEIYEKYLQEGDRRDQRSRGRDRRAPETAIGCPCSDPGHPRADVLLLKYRPQPAEVQEGVAFFGRTGQAILKSLQRLNVDPMAIYGTNCLKFADESDEEARPFLAARAAHRPAEARRRHGRDAFAFLNALDFPLAASSSRRSGRCRNGRRP